MATTLASSMPRIFATSATLDEEPLPTERDDRRREGFRFVVALNRAFASVIGHPVWNQRPWMTIEVRRVPLRAR
jgi:hypothetical protein